MSVRVRRVYDPPEPDDGVRVLVDRLWPRGVSKEAARVDEWPKGLTPSAACAAGTTRARGRTRSSRIATRRSWQPRRPPNSSTTYVS